MGKYLFLAGFNEFPDACSQCATDEGTDDENPEVGQGRAALEDGRSERTGGIDGCAGIADADEVYENEAETDGQSGEVVGGAIGLGCGTEYHEYEDAGEDDFSQQTAKNRHVGLQVVGSGTLESWDIGREDGQQCTTDEGADALEDDVHASLLGAHTSGYHASQSDGGIDVTARDAANGIGHGYDGQAERQCCAYDSGNVVDRVTTEADGHAAAHEYEHHGAHHFCEILFHTRFCFK